MSPGIIDVTTIAIELVDLAGHARGRQRRQPKPRIRFDTPRGGPCARAPFANGDAVRVIRGRSAVGRLCSSAVMVPSADARSVDVAFAVLYAIVDAEAAGVPITAPLRICASSA